MHEDRLTLDEHGRVLDSQHVVDLDATPARDVISGSDHGALAEVARWTAQRPVPAALLAGALALLVLAGLVAALAPRPGARIAIEDPESAVPHPWPALTAYYVLTADTQVRAVGLAGPMVGGSTADIGPGGVLQVDAVPDCSDPASLDAPGPATYDVQLVGPDGPVTTPLPDGVLDWGSALRQACWLERAADGLTVRDLAVRTDPLGRWLGLELTVVSSVGRAAQVSSVEFVDRARGGAQQVVLADAAGSSVLVRMPLSSCAAGSSGLRQTVPWRVSLAVGPPGSQPLAEVAVDVTREQRARVARAVLGRCAAASAAGPLAR